MLSGSYEHFCNEDSAPTPTPTPTPTPKFCEPKSSKECNVLNGRGKQICTDDGSAWGACLVESCDSAYVKSGNTCILGTCANGALNYPTCNTCSNGQYYNGSICTAQVCVPYRAKDCYVENGTGLKSCNYLGSGWGLCEVTSCYSGFKKNGYKCEEITCSNGTINYPSCNACVSGKYFDGSSCQYQICKPLSEESCSITNGYGRRTCNAEGSSRGDCKVTSCVSGYQIYNNECKKCSNGTINYPTCTDCGEGKYYTGSTCKSYLCTPNSTASCSIYSGSSVVGEGQMKCNDTGTAWGTCLATKCYKAGQVPNGPYCSSSGDYRN